MDREVCGKCDAPKALCECESIRICAAAYDVVLDVLQKHHDKLWDMTKRNMESEYIGMGIMDDIRLRQMDEIKEAIRWWKERKEMLK
jgi:hypothetical protein